MVASDVDEWNTWTFRVRSGDDREVTVEKVHTSNLKAFLHDFGGILIDAVAVSIGKNMVNDPALVLWFSVLAQVLNAPVSELTMSNEVNVVNDFIDGRSLLFFNAILEDVLHYKAAGLSKGDLVPHAFECSVNLGHDLRWFASPSKFEQFLPHMTSVAMNDSVRNTAKKFPDHVSFVVLRNRIEGLLHDVAPERIHAERDHVPMDGVCDSSDLLNCAMLETTLDKKIAEAVDHERIGLVDDGFDNVKLLFGCSKLQLLLQKYGSLLVIVTHNLVDNVLPVARD